MMMLMDSQKHLLLSKLSQ